MIIIIIKIMNVYYVVFTPVWWIAKDSLRIVALGIFGNITSLVKPRPKVQVRSSIYNSGSGGLGFKPGASRWFP